MMIPTLIALAWLSEHTKETIVRDEATGRGKCTVIQHDKCDASMALKLLSAPGLDVTHVRLVSAQLRANVVAPLVRLKQVKGLHLEHCDGSVRDLVEILDRMPWLESLEILGGSFERTKGPPPKVAKNRLKSIELAFCEEADELMASLNSIDSCLVLRAHKSQISDNTFLSLLPTASKLKRLRLTRCRIGIDTCKAIAECGDLTDLSFFDSSVGDAGVLQVCASKSILNINLSDTDITDFSISQLANTRFRTINVSHCPNVTTKAINALHDAPSRAPRFILPLKEKDP